MGPILLYIIECRWAQHVSLLQAGIMWPSYEEVMNILATLQECARLGLPSDVFKFLKISEIHFRSRESLAACWHGHAGICKVRVSTLFQLHCTFSELKHKVWTFFQLHCWSTDFQQVKYKI